MGSPNGIWMDAAAGVSDGCDVIDIDAEAKRRSTHKGVLVYGRPLTRAS
jgi:hypothetical protein